MPQPSMRRLERPTLAAYAQPRLGRSALDIATSVVPYLALSVLMYLTLGVSVLLTLALALPAAGFLVRTFVVFHDCTHGSFLALQARQRLRRPAVGIPRALRRFNAGATTTRSITRAPATSSAAASATSSR